MCIDSETLSVLAGSTQPVNSRFILPAREVNDMNPISRHEPSANFNSSCADFVSAAEQELSSFFNVVTQSFGSEQARRSAEDWLQELHELGDLPASIREWRLITVKASARLVVRVRASSLPAELQFA
jgi:hypothetical protein